MLMTTLSVTWNSFLLKFYIQQYAGFANTKYETKMMQTMKITILPSAFFLHSGKRGRNLSSLTKVEYLTDCTEG